MEIPDGKQVGYGSLGIDQREDQRRGRHFEEKGLSEMPFVENRYKELQDSKGEETARAFLTGYTADFAGATILRWQEMADEFWKMFARGF